MRQGKWGKYILAMFAAVCITMLPADVISADTDGTELQVMQPAQLEIWLGSNWAGTEFQLRTDAGLYPGELAVDETGILRLEIGSSGRYILSCMEPPDSLSVPAKEDSISNRQIPIKSSVTEESASRSVVDTEEEDHTPNALIFVFVVGGLGTVSCLILLYRKKFRS